MIWLKDNGRGGYDFSRNEINDIDWFQVSEDDPRVELIGYAEKTWVQKRLASMLDGGYGTINEQLEMISENGIEKWQDHCQNIKKSIPKE